MADESGALRRRRRGSVKRDVPLSRLLDRQPGPLKKHPLYNEMIHHYNLSSPLKSLRISRRCYTLLDKAVIAPENLVHFYKTYRLPKDPFFPLFFTIKRDYHKMKEQRAQEREDFILKEMKKLSPLQRRRLRFMAEWEETANRRKEHPLWDKSLYPHTKKRARELLLLNEYEWDELMKGHLQDLKVKYTGMDQRKIEMIGACLTLHLIPDLAPLRLPTPEQINRAYRNLCRLYHPDSGGEDRLFITLGESRNILLIRSIRQKELP